MGDIWILGYFRWYLDLHAISYLNRLHREVTTNTCIKLMHWYGVLYLSGREPVEGHSTKMTNMHRHPPTFGFQHECRIDDFSTLGNIRKSLWTRHRKFNPTHFICTRVIQWQWNGKASSLLDGWREEKLLVSEIIIFITWVSVVHVILGTCSEALF